MSQQINLFNPIFLVQKKYFSATAMLQTLGLVLAGMVLIDLVAVRQTSALEKLLADTVRDAEQRREQLIALGKQFSDQGTSKKLEEDIAYVEQRLRSRRELLEEMRTSVGGNADGFSSYLKALARQRTQGVWLTGIEVGGKSNGIVVRGKALNSDLVPIYVESLSREPVFAGRALSGLQVIAVAPPPGTAPGVGTPPAGPPLRYLEFTLSIPLGDAAAGAPQAPGPGAS
jgi:hypothetical protein